MESGSPSNQSITILLSFMFLHVYFLMSTSAFFTVISALCMIMHAGDDVYAIM